MRGSVAAFLRKRFVPILLLIMAIALLIYSRRTKESKTEALWQLQGETMGNITYHIQYYAPTQRLKKAEIDSLLHVFNKVFSTYVSDSEIVYFNRSDTLSFGSPLWKNLLKESHWAYIQSQGAFDPTVGPLVKAWGFGATGAATADTTQIAEILNYVGFDKLRISELGMGKADARLTLDMGAIAKGYAVDLVAQQLTQQGLKNYMVEIGGEVYLSGQHEDRTPWRIGIQDPLHPKGHYPAAILQISKGGVATSGNYRNYRSTGQHTYGHTIDPRTGGPVAHNLLSATVWAPSCIRADALATACLVIGLSEARTLIANLEGTEALFFYKDSDVLRSYATMGLRPYLSALRYDSLSVVRP